MNKIPERYLEKSLRIVNGMCSQLKYSEAAAFIRDLNEQYPEDLRTKQAASYFSTLLQTRFRDFISGDLVSEDDRIHYKSYATSIEKKIRLSMTWPDFFASAKPIVDEKRTLLKYDRLFTIYQAVKNIKNIEGAILELGVYRGGSVKFISELCRQQGIKVDIHAMDTFEGHISLSENDDFHKLNMFKGDGVEMVSRYLSDRPEINIIKGDVCDTLEGVLEHIEKIRFVHLDMDLYEPTLYALSRITKKMDSYAIVIVDDYGVITCPGVKKAVDEFMEQHDHPGHYLFTGQFMIIIK